MCKQAGLANFEFSIGKIRVLENQGGLDGAAFDLPVEKAQALIDASEHAKALGYTLTKVKASGSAPWRWSFARAFPHAFPRSFLHASPHAKCFPVSVVDDTSGGWCFHAFVIDAFSSTVHHAHVRGPHVHAGDLD
eukprot:364268-Chlamydomonas_euryale.AAC.14